MDRNSEFEKFQQKIREPKSEVASGQSSDNKRKQKQPETGINDEPEAKKLKKAKKQFPKIYHKYPKPQLKFKDGVDNYKPFQPKIKQKPYCLSPLNLKLSESGDYSHPYEEELKNFVPATSQVEDETILPVITNLNLVPLIYVDEESQLLSLLADICTHLIIGVDLEAHNTRSYQGFTCLMQISTVSTDYIIDTLKLRESLHCLNEVFCDPRIVKVFHDARGDIVWLQRDFGIYVVNLFDTSKAVQSLRLPKSSLSYLLKLYCNVEPENNFQTADWRVRPLPNDMLQYAREDSHFLPHLYSKMKLELKKMENGRNLLLNVWEKSKQVCLLKYTLPPFNPEDYKKLYKNLKKGKGIQLDNKQMCILKDLFAWRDGVARKEDENPGFVLGAKMMMRIVEFLPIDSTKMINCCKGFGIIPVPHFDTLLEIVNKVRDVPRAAIDCIKASNKRSKPGSVRQKKVVRASLLQQQKP